MRLFAFPLTAVLLIVTLAGCIDGAPQDTNLPVDPLALLVEALEPVHDHTDAALHEARWNLDLAAYAPLNDGPGAPGVDLSYGELDIMGDLAVVAVLQPLGGFVTVDISDPTAPEVLGYHWSGAAYAGDVKISPDGRYVFVGLNGGYAWEEVERDPLRLIPTYATSSSVEIVDITDPADPRHVSYHPLPIGGVHMLDVHVLDGDTYVFSVVYSRARLPVTFPVALPDTGVSSRIEIARLEEVPGGARLVHVSDYVPPEAFRGDGLHAPHDVTIVQDDEAGPLLLAAYGRAGVAVASLKDITRPEHLGSWTGHDGEYVHTIMMTYVEGKRVFAVAPEALASAPQNQFWFLDATDLSALTLIGTWRLPGDLHFDGGYRFSTHNFYILEGKMYLAHFHAGVWVLDVSQWDYLDDPPVLGFYMPTETGNVGTALGILAIPLTWDVIPAKGHIFATDIPTGLYVIEADWDIPDVLPYGSRGL